MKKTPIRITTRPQVSLLNFDKETLFIRMVDIPLIIGLVGPSKSGKTQIARVLVTEFDFLYLNLSYILNKLSINLGKKQGDWRQMRELAIDLRRRYGCDVLAQKCFFENISKIKNHPVVVVDGIYHPKEIEFFSKHGKFFLLNVNVSDTVRYSQVKRWYLKSFNENELKQRDEKENVKRNNLNIDDPRPNVYKCKKQKYDDINIRYSFNYRSVGDEINRIIKNIEDETQISLKGVN